MFLYHPIKGNPSVEFHVPADISEVKYVYVYGFSFSVECDIIFTFWIEFILELLVLFDELYTHTSFALVLIDVVDSGATFHCKVLVIPDI